MGAPDSGELSLERLEAFVAGAPDPELETRIETDPRLRERVEQLRTDNDLLGELGEALRTGESGPSVIDERIDGYRIKREIYRGGQGIVLEAYQEHTKRNVAVKLMLDGALASDADKARFDREVELAAQLRHPNVVTVHESGATKNGRRYIAMELVDGVRLDEACRAIGDGGAPATPEQCGEIVRLFLPICDAIAYAHRLGVIHRDLKPGNVLVTDDGRPVVLDFGIAKLAGSGEGTTRTGDFVGTLSYAAPEQLARSPNLIDTRADIYALGVMLFEALAGRRPGSSDEMSLADSIRAVTEQDAPRASSINPAVSRDLDAILRRALERDPARRYQSASNLIDELKRALAGEVVRAREGERLYLATRFLRRRRVPIAVGGALTFLVLIAVGMGFRSVAKARSASRYGETVNGILGATKTLEYETSQDGVKPPESIEELLGKISDEIGERMGEYPRYEAPVRNTLGLAYLGLRRFDEAERELRHSVQLWERVSHRDSPELADVYHNLGRVLWFRAKYTEAEREYRQALAMRERLFGGDSLLVARTKHHLAATLLAEGKFDEADPLWHEVIRVRRNLLAKDDPDIANTLLGYGSFLHEAGRSAEALGPLRESLAIISEQGGPDDWRVARVAHALGVALMSLGEYDESEQMLREARRIKATMNDAKSESSTAIELSRLLLRRDGLTEEGRALCESALARLHDLYEPDHPDVASGRLVEAEYLLADGRGDEALEIATESARTLTMRLGTSHWQVARAQTVLARALNALGRAEEARGAARRAVEILGANRPATDTMLREAQELASPG